MTISGIFSASEIALFSLNRVHLRKMKQSNPSQFRRVKTLILDPFGLLITVLLLNEIVNITVGVLLTDAMVEGVPLPNWAMEKGIPEWLFHTVLGVVTVTPILLLFCELTPKIIAARTNQLVVSLFSRFVTLGYWMVWPVRTGLRLFTKKNILTKEKRASVDSIHEEDLLLLAEEHVDGGQIHHTELEMIRRVFELDDIPVERIAIPIRKIASISEKATIQDAFQFMQLYPSFTRIPVFSGNKDNIVGILNVKALLKFRDHPETFGQTIAELTRPPLFVSALTDLESLFKRMRSRRTHIAFLRDARGAITGLVHLEDILNLMLEEVFENT
jgi:putative hemolysin